MAYHFDCDPNPGGWLKSKDRVGYLTAFNGLGLQKGLAADLVLSCPDMNPTYSRVAPANGRVEVVAALGLVSWRGDASDPFAFNCYMSASNANNLRTSSQAPGAKSTTEIGWWVANFDREQQTWFEEHYPKDPVTPRGELRGPDNKVRLEISDQPEINDLYRVSFTMFPAVGQSAAIFIAASATAKLVRAWGAL